MGLSKIKFPIQLIDGKSNLSPKLFLSIALLFCLSFNFEKVKFSQSDVTCKVMVKSFDDALSGRVFYDRKFLAATRQLNIFCKMILFRTQKLIRLSCNTLKEPFVFSFTEF
jgi:hypothetical protein